MFKTVNDLKPQHFESTCIGALGVSQFDVDFICDENDRPSSALIQFSEIDSIWTINHSIIFNEKMA